MTYGGHLSRSLQVKVACYVWTEEETIDFLPVGFTRWGLTKLNEAGEMLHLHCWWQRFRGGSLQSWSPRDHWDPETWSNPSPGKTQVTNQISVSVTLATQTHSSLISSVQLLRDDVTQKRLQCWHKQSSVFKYNLVGGLSVTSQLTVHLYSYTAGQSDL